MAIIKLSANEQRRLSAFFTCFIVAALAWAFSALSQPYIFTIKHLLTFKNAPQKRAFHSLQPDTINVEVKGTGWQMLLSRLHTEEQSINVDLRSLDSKNFVVLSSQLKDINEKKQFSNEIVAFNPDTLYFDFSKRISKKIPVKLMATLSYQPQFAQSNHVTINPGYVTVTGPQNVLENIKEWDTDSLKLPRLSENYDSKLNLRLVSEGNMNIYPKSVQVIVPVDEFTEKTVEIPVKLVGNHDYYNVKIFPQKVTVTFTTSLNKFNVIDEDNFKAEADLTLWSEHSYSNLPVKFTETPPYCKIIKVDPQNVDFIVRK